MTWQIQWTKMVIKRPALSDPKAQVVITSDQLQSLLSQAYERGVKDGKKLGGDPFGGLFGGMFK